MLCNGSKVAELENNRYIALPQQARDLADQKWRLSEAEAGRAEAAEEFNKALRARVNAMKSSGAKIKEGMGRADFVDALRQNQTDLVYAGLKGRFTAQEAAQWRDNVAKLSSAHQDLKDRVNGYRQDLTSGLCGPRVAQQVQNSPKPSPPAEAARTTPPPAPTASVLPPAPTPGPSLAKILGWTAVLAGGAVGRACD